MLLTDSIRQFFDNAPDVFVSKDEMTGELLAASESLLGDKGTIIPESGDGYVMVYSGVAITDDLNLDTIIFKYRADSWAFVDSVIIKIGNKRYKLEKCRHLSGNCKHWFER